MKLLVAEDNLLSQQLMSMYMKRLGWEVVIVNDGLEAIESSRSGVFDVIIMDVDMPLLDGLEATQYIRTFNTKIPIIAISAYADEQMRDDCVKAGMTAFLSKPTTKAELVTVVNQCISGNRVISTL